MKTKNKEILLILVFFFSFIFLSHSGYAWLSGWVYRKPILINNTANSNTLTDYQIAINLSVSTWTNKPQPDFSDIRFTYVNSSGEYQIPYWIESKVNSQWAYVWVKIPYIPASSTATIYVYYGNISVVSSASNATVVYDIYDDFSSGCSNWNIFRTGGGGQSFNVYLSHIGGACQISFTASYDNFGGIGKLINISKGFVATWRAMANSSSSEPNPRISLLFFARESSVVYNGYVFGINPLEQFYRIWKGGSIFTGAFVSGGYGQKNTWFNFKIVTFINSSGIYSYAYKDDSLLVSWYNSTVDYTEGYIAFGGGAGGGVYSIIVHIDDLKVRKYTYPEPTASIGAEESLNQPPVIAIYSPLNQSYLSAKNFLFNFSATDDRNTTFILNAYLDGSLIYSNNSYRNNTIVTIYLNLTQDKSYNFTVFANDTDAYTPKTSTQTVIFTVKAFQIEAINFNSNVYETSNQNFSEIIKVNWDLISNITANLVWNSTNYGNANWQANSTHIILTKQITIPLIQVNNTQVSFYFANLIQYKNGTQATVNTQTNNQNILYAYYIESLTTDRDNYIEFEDSLIQLKVKDLLGKASLYTNFTFIYNSSYNLTKAVSDYQISSQLKIFNATFDTFESFSNSETRNITAKLSVSFQGNERIMEANKTINVFKIILTNCSSSSPSQTKALTFYVKNEEDDSPITNATIEATFDVWKTGEIKRNYAWKFYLENTNNQSVCIYPSWAEYTIDVMIQYYKAGFKDRTYYIYTRINNSTTGATLYLLDENLGNVIIIYVRDENGNKVENAIVKVQRYYVGSNSYKTVAQVRTDYEGKGVTFLRVNEIYYRFIIEKNFIVLRETQPTIITCTSGGCPPYPITLSISEQMPALYFRYLDKVAYACQLNEQTNILKCTVDDTSQLMQKARLIVEQRGALKFETLCDNVCESSACTLTCDLGNRTNKLYRYQLLAYFSEPPVVLEQNILDYLTGIIWWGSQGLLIAFLITSTLFFIGIWNPVTSMVFAFLGIIVGYLFGMIPVSIASLIGLGLAIGILIYKLRT